MRISLWFDDDNNSKFLIILHPVSLSSLPSDSPTHTPFPSPSLSSLAPILPKDQFHSLPYKPDLATTFPTHALGPQRFLLLNGKGLN